MIITKNVSFSTRGDGDIIDITDQVEQQVAGADIDSGVTTVFVAGSTAGITTIEYEPGLIADLQSMWQRLIPKGIPYDHDRRWGDGNGYAHVRAALLGASLTIPFRSKKLLLGRWQQLALIDFDNRPRSRQVILQIMGE